MSVALFVGGWEPTGVAGLAVDLKTAASLDVHAAGVVTAITAQGRGVHAVDLTSEELLAHQLARVSSLPISTVKIGMIGSAPHVRTLARWLASREALVVYDPVLRASTGGALFVAEDVPALRELLPRVDLLTPNLDEAELLCGLPGGSLARSDDAIEDAAMSLLELGARAVLIKGGHGEGACSQDFFRTRCGERAWLTSARVSGARGTGCALAAAIACAHGWGAPRVLDLVDAIVVGKAYVQRGLCAAQALSSDDSRALGHGAWPVDADDLPWITDRAAEGRARPTAPPDVIGFYPIVSAAAQVASLVRAGVTTAQLRVKDRAGAALRREIEAGVAAAHGSACRLYINDHIEEAIVLGAYGVHLGQEDLRSVGRGAVERAIAADLRIGVSTHTYAELARAIAIRPSYVALGPIYPTTLKSMRYPPQGPARLSEWRRLCTAPLVAIGGITLARVPELHGAGVAVVGDLQVGALDARARAYLAACES